MYFYFYDKRIFSKSNLKNSIVAVKPKNTNFVYFIDISSILFNSPYTCCRNMNFPFILEGISIFKSTLFHFQFQAYVIMSLMLVLYPFIKFISLPMASFCVNVSCIARFDSVLVVTSSTFKIPVLCRMERPFSNTIFIEISPHTSSVLRRY